MRAMIFLFLILTSVVVFAGCPTIKEPEARRACIDKQYAIQQRIWATKPSRKNGPLRQVNLNDIEVREIEEVVEKFFPDSIVNISGVTVGCPCEDGSKCEDQVWLMAATPTESKELKLSKIEGHWTIGPIQQWWLKYDSFIANRSKFQD